MNLEFAPHHKQLRDDVRAFLRENWPASDIAGFRREAVARGYLYRGVPSIYGGAEQPDDAIAEEIIEQEFTEARAPQGIVGQGPDMIVPTLLAHGTEAQRREFIEPTLFGEISWCQGYSEPGSGSDLASLSSRAELVDGKWVIHGHKIWTSDAPEADWMFGLFRTEPEEPRHAGISFLLVPMDQRGLEVRPINAMTGRPEFAEVFLDGATTDIARIVGDRGQGWQVSRSLLVHERNLQGFRMQQLFNNITEIAQKRMMAGKPAIEHPVIRYRLAELEADLLAAKYSRIRAITYAAHGNDPNAVVAATVKKLHASQLLKRLTQAGLDIAGADEGLRGPGSATVDLGMANQPGGWTLNYLFSHCVAIGAGAPNIQRNIIGERALGLPRDLRP